jgi:hypothetical protein
VNGAPLDVGCRRGSGRWPRLGSLEQKKAAKRPLANWKAGLWVQERRRDRNEARHRKDCYDPLRAGMSYALTEAMDEGHRGLPTDQLIPLTEELLEAPR